MLSWEDGLLCQAPTAVRPACSTVIGMAVSVARDHGREAAQVAPHLPGMLPPAVSLSGARLFLCPPVLPSLSSGRLPFEMQTTGAGRHGELPLAWSVQPGSGSSSQRSWAVWCACGLEPREGV